jgi:oxygen-independent coproporphyrinogen-3 oxidase
MTRVIPIARGGGAPARLAALPPLALYAHFPWCVRKCPYCDFNSHEVRPGAGGFPEDAYVDALIADLESALPAVWGRRIVSVFIGGGTPSLLAPASVERFLAAVRARCNLNPDAEITLEANPGTVEAGRFAGYRAAGVNRLSLGVQSFDAGRLAAIGRIHDGAQAHAAVAEAVRQLDNVNLDLMYALPGQTPEQALTDIDAAIACDVQHLSAYHLTIEPNTAFHHDPPALPEDDVAATMQEAIEARLAAAGYERYEVSAFARPGRRCRHNLNYWQFGDYLGIGAGAHAKISSPAGIVRETRPRQPKAYMEAVARGQPVQDRRAVAAADLPFEFMMNALRLVEGVPARLFAERTGLPPEAVRREIERARAAGLLEADAQQLRPSARGLRFLNDLLEGFLPEKPVQP